MKRLERANQYIQAHRDQVTERPLFHLTPEVGWMNDPNGFIYYRGQYHLFYQHYPYDTAWSDMHWGHAVSDDLVHWRYLPVALANDTLHDANGCFSGSAIEKDGKLYLMYTGHLDPNLGYDREEDQVVETQCLAYSEDGVTFHKYPGNPVIGKDELPEGYLICDFRDPKIWEAGGVYYCVLSVRNSLRRGEILLFQSHNLTDWTFHSSIYQSRPEENILLECPDLFRIGDKDVLVVSVMPCDPEFQQSVENHTLYMIGELDYENGRFLPESSGLLDYGSTFYAPQSAAGKEGERIMFGWMHRWHQPAPPKEYGFTGMMSLPRRLDIQSGRLIQQPGLHVEQHFEPMATHEHVLLNAGASLKLEGQPAAYLRLEVKPGAGRFVVELHRQSGLSGLEQQASIAPGQGQQQSSTAVPQSGEGQAAVSTATATATAEATTEVAATSEATTVNATVVRATRLAVDMTSGTLTLSSDYSDQPPIIITTSLPAASCNSTDQEQSSVTAPAPGTAGGRSEVNGANSSDTFDDGLTLELFIDLHSIELFVNSGEKVATLTAYSLGKGCGLSLSGEEDTAFRLIHYASLRQRA
ncbi:glycoside hydrolase family 32 protein [Paenibacillus sp. SYP-B4298]|uniref:glycoside hydrolase family 32 protein n=1 Tax=Paenibacillus sp. SYP-B4298 TaxID=2996034 RepID=UPI0022DE5F1E|nr:glycoside hydrolase family 32 protein [Paenibacillus sp. SYP-B4298]